MLALIVVLVSMLTVGIGVLGMVSPARQVSFVSRWQSMTGLWVSSITRLVFGIALWAVAPSSRTPFVLQVLAALSVGAALIISFMGISRFRSILSWWSRQSTTSIRAWSALTLAFGIFLLWLVMT